MTDNARRRRNHALNQLTHDIPPEHRSIVLHQRADIRPQSRLPSFTNSIYQFSDLAIIKGDICIIGRGVSLWGQIEKALAGLGKGGGGGSVTTYEYSASFLLSLGLGPASAIRRIWADSKLIYDATGTGETNNSKYKFRFYKGVPTQGIDPLVEESINRRLAGLPDVNEGSGEQATYTTMDDLIASATASAAATG